jgi:hypothetical protein
MTNKSAPFHHEWEEAADKGLNTVKIAARELGKTADAMADILHAICYEEAHFIHWFGYDESTAKERLYNVVAELKTNQRILADFGALWSSKKAQEFEMDGKQAIGEFVTTNGVYVKACGLGTSIRGSVFRGKTGKLYRPDLIFLDDIDVSKSVESQEMIDKNYRLLKGEIIGSVAPTCRFVILGNVIRNDGLAKRLYEEMKDQPNWKCFWQPARNEDGTSAWADRIVNTNAEAEVLRSQGKEVVSLEEKLSLQKSIAFGQNFLLVPYSGAEQIVKRDRIRWESLPEGVKFDRITVGVDPAISLKVASDGFAIVVVGWIKEKRYCIL